MEKKITVYDIVAQKGQRKITVLTAYDASMAAVLDDQGIDIVLVGDSVGMVVLGYNSTVPVTMDEMIHHAKAVRNGVRRALLVGDMPFLSYQTSHEEAIRNGGRFLKEAGCDAVKVEGGEEVCDTVRAMVRAGIPVMGHIGLTPQTASQLGGFRVQGRDVDSARRQLAAAKALAEAGIFSLVLECIPDQLAGMISEAIPVPTIGIGAGPLTDGQVLVTNDVVGLFERFTPKFVKKYAELAPQIRTAIAAFREEVEAGSYPGPGHCFTMKPEVLKRLEEE